ncbi:MAG TPA: SCP2 sterol-binding domain-containing protein [Pseudonocardiaceae bacterium]
MSGRHIVDEIIRRFPDYVDPESARGVHGVVRWELTGFDGEPDEFTLVVEDGEVKVDRDLPGEATVTLRLGVVSFLKLAAGQGDPSTMALSGDLEIHGDAWFALELLRLFAIPSRKGTLRVGGPDKVDLGAVARLVRQVPDRLLRHRLRGAVRRILLDEIFRRLPTYLDAERVAGVDALVAWRISGAEDGGHDEYRTHIREGGCVVGVVGVLPGRPRTTIRTDPTLFFKLVTGNASPALAYLRRRLSVRGDLRFAARLPRIFDISTG